MIKIVENSNKGSEVQLKNVDIFFSLLLYKIVIILMNNNYLHTIAAIQLKNKIFKVLAVI